MYSTVIQLYIYVYIYMYIFQIIFPYRLLQNIEYSSLCYTVGLVGYLFYISRCMRAQSCGILCDPHGLYIACQPPLSIEFLRQEYWNKLPFPSPGDLPYPGIEPASLESPALAGSFFAT